MPLSAIAYVSSATHDLSDAELEELLAKAQERNRRHAVTGALLYHDGSFFQYFEGPDEGLDIVYQHIRRSPLHFDIVELMHSPIKQRSFSDWWMGFARAPASAILQLADASWHQHLQQQLAAQSASIGMTLLLEFWRTNRGATAPPAS
jgi:hypothetical protein